MDILETIRKLGFYSLKETVSSLFISDAHQMVYNETIYNSLKKLFEEESFHNMTPELSNSLTFIKQVTEQMEHITTNSTNAKKASWDMT